MTVSVRLHNQEDAIIPPPSIPHSTTSAYQIFCANPSCRESMDENDLKAYEEAKAEFKKDPKTYTFGDIKAEFGTLKVVKNPESRQ